jgi:hypothetical protein
LAAFGADAATALHVSTFVKRASLSESIAAIRVSMPSIVTVPWRHEPD